MTEQELWKNIVHDPSDEKQHQAYANACVDHDLEKEALQRYKQMQNAYPAISAKFTKQLTTAVEFKLMPASPEADISQGNSLLGRLKGFVHSILLTGVSSLAYGIIKKSLLEILIGVVLIAAYMSYMVNKQNRINRN